MSQPFAAAQYLPGFPSLVLPGYARPDLAYIELSTVSLPGGGTLYTATGDSFAVPLSLYVQLRTDGTARARIVTLEIVNDVTAQRPFFVSSPSQQTASLNGTYSFTAGLADAYTAIDTGGNPLTQIGMPYTVVAPGFSLVLAGADSSTSDAFGVASLTLLQIPTGPPLPSASVVPVATPVLV